MRLEMGLFPVDNIVEGNDSTFSNGLLTLNFEQLRGMVMEEGKFEDVSFHIALPGDSVRITNVLDAVEPIHKINGNSCEFPGFLGPARTAGDGKTHKLSGMCVLSSTYFLGPQTGIMTCREGIIDMSGPGTKFCTNSDTFNLVIRYIPLPSTTNVEHDDAVRLSTLRISSWLGSLTKEMTPKETKIYELLDVDPSLPKVVYVDQVMHQAPMVQTFMYGKDLGDSLPTLIHPNEMLDGAVVGANYKTSQKVPTYLHCNKPLILELYRRHGIDLNFAGMILTRGHRDNQALKERSAQYVAKLAKILHADGAVLSFEGGGNSSVDYWLTVQALEQMEITAVPIVYEVGRPGTSEFPLVYHVPEANSIISKGANGDKVDAPAMERVIGSKKIFLYGGQEFNASGNLQLTNSDYYATEWALDLNGFVGKDY
ncbi:MAG: glycine/sarcosine/betaine reductase component B subunit [Nitrospinota bacterium]|nr:glycine/sarcosine/betaine reductase component B subunit [Nitrospinota bacterium]